MPPTPRTSSTPSPSPAAATPGQGVRRPAPGPLRGQSRRDLRPGQHQVPGRGAGARRHECAQLAPNSLAGYNVTSLALEVPASCLTAGSDPVIGGWTTASLRQAAVLNPQPQSAKSVASVGAVTAADRRIGRGRRLDAGVAPGHAAGQRTGHRSAGQGPLQCLRAEERRAVRRLRDQSRRCRCCCRRCSDAPGCWRRMSIRAPIWRRRS